MLGRHRRRWSKLSALARLSPDQRRYVRLIKSERALDREHYGSVHGWLHPLLRMAPERHYVTLGEPMGLSPAPGFVPPAYLRLNPDIPPGVAPLYHYLTKGREAGLLSVETDQVDVPQPPPLARQSDLAVVAHVHYLEVWPELVEQVRSSGISADLFVTTTRSQSGILEIEEALGDCCPNRSVSCVPNQGRDAGSFVHLVNSGVLDGYEAVCKIHTKVSPGRDGTAWRRELLDAILPVRADEIIESFLRDEQAQVMTAKGWIRSGPGAWGLNREGVARLLEITDDRDLNCLPAFPAGSMYWVKPAVLNEIRDLGLDYDDFEPEPGRVDGTPAHAFERTIGFLCARAHGRVVEASAYGAPRLDS